MAGQAMVQECFAQEFAGTVSNHERFFIRLVFSVQQAVLALAYHLHLLRLGSLPWGPS